MTDLDNTEEKSVGGETVIDTGWRTSPEQVEEGSDEGSRTVIDTGWRTSPEQVEEGADEGSKTVIDTGWRASPEQVEEGADNGSETVIDTGWRGNSEQVEEGEDEGSETVIDTGWRGNSEQTEEADEGSKTIVGGNWREQLAAANNEATADSKTVVGENWRERLAESESGDEQIVPDTPIGDMSTEEFITYADQMTRSTVEVYKTIERFREAASNIEELVSKTGKKYKVLEPFGKKGGEAAILLCTDENGEKTIAKIYYRPVEGRGSSVKARSRVIEYMKTKDGQKYTLPIEEIGLVKFEGCTAYFELMPFCEEGDLLNAPPMDFSEIEKVTEFLNEAVHSIHKFGLLHRDIKPENIYRLDGRYVLADFGVAQLVTDGPTRYHVGTDGYCAPEVLMALSGTPIFVYDTRCDYYSIGPTLASLFEGRFIYTVTNEDGTLKVMDDKQIMSCIQSDTLPLTREDPHRPQLERLLKGLCSMMAERRFNYGDVKMWLADHDYTGSRVTWPKPFFMLDKEYNDTQSLFYGITQDSEHWAEGVELLYDKYFENFFKSFRTDLARSAQQIADKYRVNKRRDKGLAEFLKRLYKAGPIVWRGYTYEDLSALADKMSDTKTPRGYAELLTENVVSDWVNNTPGIDISDEQKQLVSDIEKKALKYPETACYWFGLAFCESAQTTICGAPASSLSDAVKNIFASPSVFYESGGAETLTVRSKGSQFYGLLYKLGYGSEVEQTESNCRSADDFDRICAFMEMLDTIAEKENESSDVIRKFFTDYGPYSYALYMYELASKTEEPVYEPVDKEGKTAIKKVTHFTPVSGIAVGELIKAYSVLETEVINMQKLLVDNPYRLLSGTYSKEGIICTDLEGVCAFDFLGRKAPLGFYTKLKQESGGTQ